jgi:hypothetical protein
LTDKKFYKPAEGVSLPLSDGRPWPTEGDWIDLDQYARRRIADGDIVAAKPPAIVAEPEAETKKGK